MNGLETTVKVIADPLGQQKHVDPSLLENSQADSYGVVEQGRQIAADVAAQPYQPMPATTVVGANAQSPAVAQLQQPLGTHVVIHQQVMMRQVAPGVMIHEASAGVPQGAAQITAMSQPDNEPRLLSDSASLTSSALNDALARSKLVLTDLIRPTYMLCAIAKRIAQQLLRLNQEKERGAAVSLQRCTDAVTSLENLLLAMEMKPALDSDLTPEHPTETEPEPELETVTSSVDSELE